MFYFLLTGEITNINTESLIHFFNSKIIDENYSDTITIYLSSIGGDIDAAIRVYDFLKSIPNKVHTIGLSQVDSAAITIYLAGDKRTALFNTRFRIHEPNYFIRENSALLPLYEERVNLFRELDKRMKEITAKEIKKDIKIIQKLYQQGKILNTQEAKEFGMVHEILNSLPKPSSLNSPAT